MSPKLPFDVQIMAVEWIYRLSQSRQVEYGTLASCSIVCKDWVIPAQRLLFRRIPQSIDGRVSVPLLVRTIRGKRILGTYIRSITFDNASGYQLDGRPVPSDEDAVTLLGLCRNIAHISFLISSDYDLWWYRAEPRLATFGLRPVSLSLAYNSATAVRRTLKTWPTIRHLRVGGIHGEARYLAPEPGVFGVLSDVAIPSDVDIGVLGSAAEVEKGVSSLREVEFTGNMHNGGIPSNFVAHGHTLIRSLTCTDIPSPAVLEHLPHLEELVFRVLVGTPPPLPRTLRHVGFHAEYVRHDAAERIVAMLSGLPELELVTAIRVLSKNTLLSLERACKSLDVDFVVYPDARSFPVSGFCLVHVHLGANGRAAGAICRLDLRYYCLIELLPVYGHFLAGTPITEECLAAM